MLPKLIKLFLLFIITIVVFSAFLLKNYKKSEDLNFGVTYSFKYAKYLGLDVNKTFISILEDLKVKNLRLPTYWDILEKNMGEYDFSQTDFLLNESEKRDVRVLLVVGARQPRWPECHYPSWARSLSVEQRKQKTLELIQKVVERYKDNKSIWAYQVENEPFAFWFGDNCDSPSGEFLKKEVDLVRKLDPKKPIVITDSGEWGLWVDTISYGDILGTSIYRKAYNSQLKTYMTFPFFPSLYSLKAELVKQVPGNQSKKVIASEIQAEPWLARVNSDEDTAQGQAKLFSVDEFKQNIEFVKNIGFDQNYLWGVEWWYWMEKQGYPQYLDYAKTVLN